MENKKERVLAYSMAKVISDAELAEVSGGWAVTSGITGGGSSGSGQVSEVHVDVHWDW